MVYDFFPFFNELELLEMRLTYLDPIVDKFVLIEANTTTSGQKKPFYFLKNKERFSKWLHKIEHIQLTFPDSVSETWARETYQRAQLYYSDTWQKATPDDYIIISDLDEIPSHEVIQYIRDNKLASEMPILLHTLMCRYYINLAEPYLWTGITVLKGNIKERNPTPEIELTPAHYFRAIRLHPQHYHRPELPVKFEGWHFSYFGGVDRVIRKLKAAAHQEFSGPKYTNREYIKQCLKQGICCCHGVKLYNISIKDFPKEIVDIARKYKMIL